MDKRRAVRVKLFKPCTVIINDKEYKAMLNDISRVGISFDVEAPMIDIYSDVKFVVDGGEDFGKISGKCNVVRTTAFNGTSFIGCALDSISNMEYIKRLELKASVKKALRSAES